MVFIVTSSEPNPKALPPPSPINSSNSFHFLRLFLKCTYFVGLAPFRIIETPNGFQLHSNKLQKVLCGLVHLAATIYATYATFSTLPQHKLVDSPWLLFKKGLHLAIWSYYPVFLWSVWRKQQLWLNFFRECELQPGIRASEIKWKRKYSVAVMVWLLVPSLASALWTLSTLSILGDSSTANFNTSQSRDEGAINQENEFTWIWETCITFAMSALSSLIMTFVFYVEILPGLAILTLRWISLEFEQTLNDPEATEEMVFTHYLLVRKICDHLNSIVSSLLLSVLCMGMMYYSMATLMLFDSDALELKFEGLVAGGLQIGGLTLAAASSQKINKIKRWIVKRSEQEARNTQFMSGRGNDKRALLMHAHICDEPIGLNCGPLFTFTYHSLGTGLGLLATYIIIVLQLYSSPSKIPPSDNLLHPFSG